MPEIRSYEDLQDMKAAIEAKVQSSQARVDAIAKHFKGKPIADQIALLSIVRERIQRSESFLEWALVRIRDRGDQTVMIASKQAREQLSRWEDYRLALTCNIDLAFRIASPKRPTSVSFSSRHLPQKEWVIAEYDRLTDSYQVTGEKVVKEVIKRRLSTNYWEMFGELLMSQFPKKTQDELFLSEGTIRNYIEDL